MILRPFRDYTSHIFGNMLCEVHFNELIRNINSPNLHIIEDSYVVEMGI